MKYFKQYRSVSHWLSYNGKFLAYAGVFLVMILILRYNSRDAAPADYRLSWVGKTALSDEETDALERAVAASGADQNGDGAVTLAIDQYIVDFEDVRTTGDADTLADAYGYMTKLIARLQDQDCYLFLTDNPERLQYLTGVLRYLDGGVPGEDGHYESANWARMAVPLELDGWTREAWLARRSLFEENADYEAVFPGGEALFRALAGFS